jgi:hypothetical protein
MLFRNAINAAPLVMCIPLRERRLSFAFIQCDACKEKCTAAVLQNATIIHLSEEEQKPFAEGLKNGNKIFKRKIRSYFSK